MKKLNQFAVAALAAAGLITGSSHALAQSVGISSNSPDLIMGFRVADGSTGTGGNTNLELDLGYTAASLLAAAGGLGSGGTVTLGGPGFQTDLSGSDLATAFGSNWYTLTSGGGKVEWSVFGADTTLGTNEFWITNQSSFYRSTNQTQGNIVAEIGNLYAGLSDATSTANSDADFIDTSAKGDGNSYTNAITNGETGGNWEYSFGTSEMTVGSNTPIGLYDSPVQTGNNTTESATEIGTFALGNNGTLTFTAVPEPSTWASIVLGAFALLAFRRRRLA